MERVAKKVYIPIITVCAALVCVCLFLVGCASAPKLSFVPSEIDMFVGDERDLALYAVYKPATTDDKSFTLKASDECVSVSGTKIKAVKPGTCTLTAKNGDNEAKMVVNVSYRAPQALAFDVDGDIVRTIDNTGPITFSAALDDYSDPDIVISWTVNGNAVATGSEYVLEPNGVGEYAVCASAAGLTKREIVRVYNETDASGYSDGSLSQYRSFSPVRFYAVEDVDANNPKSVYRWTVNGEVKSSAREFEFTPLSLGTYKIGLNVNGVARDVDGEKFASVVATGDRAPNGYVEFDDADGVFVKWSDGAVARSVAIVNGNGDRTVYSSSDSRYTHLFGAGSFDASEIISPTSGAPKTFTVTVYADAAGEPFEFAQYPYGAEKYIAENVLCKNSFLTSKEQAAEWVAELYAVGATKAEGYLSREVVGDADGMIAAAVEAAAKLGISATAEAEGEILSIELSSLVNSPSKNETSTRRQAYIYVPHFEMYGSINRRASDYRLAIERAGKEVEVSNTEQLLLAAGCGVLPKPVAETSAARVYASARSVLMSIIGRNYTDEQKAHAIYDWLQFCTLRVVGGDRASIANYLEGVFDNKGGDSALVVSDLGAAKSFALLCGMEGISCRIKNDGGDFYNAVEIGGLWYNVDVYDGEVSNDTTERCTHAGLFYADGEPDVVGSCYDGSLSFYLQKNTRDGVYYDLNIDGDDDEDVIKAAVWGAFDGQARQSFDVKLPSGHTSYFNIYYGVEFLLDGLNGEQRTSAISLIEEVVAEYIEEYVKAHYDGEDVQSRIDDYLRFVRLTSAGNVVWVTPQIPTFAANS